jgi:hybrid cluster-associated redox disulfide protein
MNYLGMPSTACLFVFCYLRQRKEGFFTIGYLWGMDTTTIDIQLTVDQVLQRWPHAFSVFMRNKTKCVGCFMQPFCTLKDVAETYQLSLEKLVNEIKNTSNEGI